MTLIARIKRYFARQKHKYKTKLQYSNPDICKIELETIKYIYHGYEKTLNDYFDSYTKIFTEYMHGRLSDANTKEYIDYYSGKIKNVLRRMKMHLIEYSHVCRLYLFFTKKGCINEYYPKRLKEYLKSLKFLYVTKNSYNPYLDFKKIKIKKKKKDLEKDFH